MPKFSPEDRAALAQKLMNVDPAQFGQISDQFMQELGRRTNGLPMPTTRATSTPTASPAPAASPASTPPQAPEAQAALISKPNVSPDVAYLAKTAFGEGEGEGPEGQRAIMHVIANRMSRKKGKSVQDIVQAPSQFESWDQNNPRRPVMEGLDLNDPKHAALVALAQAVLAGKDKDNTSGSTLFWNPSVANPAWGPKAKPTAKIGRHQFASE